LNSSEASYPGSIGETFYPIPQLNQSNADLTLHFLSSATKFTQPVYDPWFSAQSLYTDKYRLNQTYYVAEWPVKVVACTEKWQLCMVGTGHCTPLSTLGTLRQQVATNALGMDIYGRQGMIGNRIAFQTLPDIIPTLGSGYLLAQQYNTLGYSSAVPDNQWILEFENWFGIRLTGIQRYIIDHIVGPSNPRYQRYVVPPPANQTWMCENQIVQRSGYSSFSIFGMAIILIVGGLIIVTNLTIDSILGLVRSWIPGRLNGSLEWKLTSLLQLQRMAFEGRNKGTWSKQTSLVPVTDNGDEFVFHDDVEGTIQELEHGNSNTHKESTTLNERTDHAEG
jgi:hypothetical protein